MRIHVLILIIIQENFFKKKEILLAIGELIKQPQRHKTYELPQGHAYKTFTEILFNICGYKHQCFRKANN